LTGSLSGVRPRRLVVVVGTGTDVGKTWVAARLLIELRGAGATVAARKPAQSFDPDDDQSDRDAAVLGAASGEPPEMVCPPHRWYEVPMAPPMAAEALGRPPFRSADLVGELGWPCDPVDVGLVETAGGVRSPLAADGDCAALCAALAPDLVVLADAGLGTINAVRLTVDALRAPGALGATRASGAPGAPGAPIAVVLNRFDAAVGLHIQNEEWLRSRDGLTVVALPGGERDLAALTSG
jgi:dethiobiotin synthetase